eukprot:scaffold4463_cov60-Phaeocystis_antarctica.AAC.4
MSHRDSRHPQSKNHFTLTCASRCHQLSELSAVDLQTVDLQLGHFARDVCFDEMRLLSTKPIYLQLGPEWEAGSGEHIKVFHHALAERTSSLLAGRSVRADCELRIVALLPVRLHLVGRQLEEAPTGGEHLQRT